MKANPSVLLQLGMRIAYLRKEKKMSQLALALEADVSKSFLCDLEKGRRNPSILILNQISKALGLTLEELFRGVVSLDQLF